MTHSPEQLAFFNALSTTSSNILLSASAGSGKSTTIKEAIRLNPSRRCLLLAFNKDIVEAIKPHVPSNAVVSTFHSLGLSTWKTSRFPSSVRVDASKLKTLAKTYIPKSHAQYHSPVCRLVDWAKSFGVGIFTPNEESSFRDLISHFDEDFDVPDESRLVFYAVQILASSNSELTVVDFSDMLYFPLLHRCSWPRFDWVFIDEAQDTNAVQAALLSQLLTPPPNSVFPPPRLIAVGDPHQAIYGFRGADSEALASLAKTFSMTELPLSVSFRCSQRVVAEAQRIISTPLK